MPPAAALETKAQPHRLPAARRSSSFCFNARGLPIGPKVEPHKGTTLGPMGKVWGLGSLGLGRLDPAFSAAPVKDLAGVVATWQRWCNNTGDKRCRWTLSWETLGKNPGRVSHYVMPTSPTVAPGHGSSCGLHCMQAWDLNCSSPGAALPAAPISTKPTATKRRRSCCCCCW